MMSSLEHIKDQEHHQGYCYSTDDMLFPSDTLEWHVHADETKGWVVQKTVTVTDRFQVRKAPDAPSPLYRQNVALDFMLASSPDKSGCTWKGRYLASTPPEYGVIHSSRAARACRGMILRPR